MNGLPVSFPLGEGWMIISGLAGSRKRFTSRARSRPPSVTLCPTETGSAGFNILAERAGEWTQLNDALIPSKVIDSVEPTDYHVSIVTQAVLFYLEEVSIDGKRDRHGPFAGGKQYGVYVSSPRGTGQAASGNQIHLPLILR